MNKDKKDDDGDDVETNNKFQKIFTYYAWSNGGIAWRDAARWAQRRPGWKQLSFYTPATTSQDDAAPNELLW